MNNAVLAVDLGGTNIRMAAVAADGTILHSTRRETPRSVSPEELVALIGEMANDCSDISNGRQLISMAIGVPANVTREGFLRHYSNIPTLDGADLGSMLSRDLGLPVLLENDATAAAIGESWLGVSKGIDNSILVTLGTGVGGGVIVNGRPLRGSDGGAGKIGHICVEPDGHTCGCGSHGCIEQYASATALVRMAKEAGLEVASATELFQVFENGDVVAASVFTKMGFYLGITLAGLVNTLNPEMIVIGGGVSAAWKAFIEPLKNEIHYRAFAEPATRAQIVRASLGDSSGILGAAHCAFLNAEAATAKV